MMLDTGATELSITQSVAYSLVNAGEAAWGPNGPVSIADGSTHEVQSVFIRHVTLGRHIVTNVRAFVVADNATMLLGGDILRRFGKFTVDNARSQLTFN
jgi:clan AA aspartic protease (TIGR02281 family)